MNSPRLRMDYFDLYVMDLTSSGEQLNEPGLLGRCDCFLIERGTTCDLSLFRRLACWVVSLDCDWVQCFGRHAEMLHDLVDQASVDCGRQQRIGDGNPMTSWESEAETSNRIMDQICSGGFGYQTQKLLVLFGDEQECSRFLKELQSPHEIRP